MHCYVMYSNTKFIFKTESKVGDEYKYILYYIGIKLWHDLPVNVQLANSMITFRHVLVKSIKTSKCYKDI